MSLTQRRTLIILVSILILASIAGIIYAAIPRSYLALTISPQSATIKIDNQRTKAVTNGEKLTISPGNHTITLSRSGFASNTAHITTTNRQTKSYLMALTAQSAAAKKLVLDSTDQDIIQKYGGQQQQAYTAALDKNYPIINDLPITSDHYLISACPSQKYPNDKTKIALCVKEDSTDYNTAALWAIQNTGYNPSMFEIIWQPLGAATNGGGD